MTATQIQKALYKEKPNAHLQYIRSSVAYYYADLDELRVHFAVPTNDMGEADFKPTMEAKYLFRWLMLQHSDQQLNNN
jgi:hypothetical protein